MSDMETSNLLPEFAGFGEHVRAGHLAFPHCLGCGQFHWYPMPRCPHCQGRDVEWRRVSGRGELVSFTRVLHAFDSSRADRLPYVVALVRFADAPGVNLISNIVGSDKREPEIGRPVKPVFRIDEQGRPVVEFQVM